MFRYRGRTHNEIVSSFDEDDETENHENKCEYHNYNVYKK